MILSYSDYRISVLYVFIFEHIFLFVCVWEETTTKCLLKVCQFPSRSIREFIPLILYRQQLHTQNKWSLRSGILEIYSNVTVDNSVYSLQEEVITILQDKDLRKQQQQNVRQDCGNPVCLY